MTVDARGLRLSGIGRYLREVLRVVLADPRVVRVALAGNPADLVPFIRAEGAERTARIVPFAHHFYAPAAQLHWAALQARGALRSDVVFFPHYDVPLTDRSPRTVVTVQDLNHFRLAEQFAGWKVAVAARVLRRAVRRASRVVVTSQWTHRDLVGRHPDVAARVSVIPLGVTPGAAVSNSPSASARVADLTSGGAFLLCVGNRKPHKNLVAAVEVLARLSGRLPGLRLVLVGEDFGEDAEVRARAAERGVADAIVWFGRASDAELTMLFAGAGCLLFPSLYEGFGLPPLEAMAAGVPVVASDRASIPEVVGNAAATLDPHDWDGMADAAFRLLTDPAHRAEMVRRGLRRSEQFRWEDTGARVADLIWEVGAGRGTAAPRGEPHVSAAPGHAPHDPGDALAEPERGSADVAGAVSRHDP